MKRKLKLLCLCGFAVASTMQADPAKITVADRAVLTAPILFCKRFNYQGLHIYDTFFQWRPGGGIYVLENPADPPEQHRVRAVIDPTTPETLGHGIYFDPSLAYDAKKLLFCFKGAANGNSVICEIGVDGRGLRQITNLDNNGNPYLGSGGGHHDVTPCYLPDGRIVFTSTRYSGLVPCANNGVAILHVMNADGSDIHTISVNNVTEFDPCVLADGRIMFGRWEYIDRNALVIQSLWSVLPDGRNEMEMFANNMVFPEAVLQAKPVPGNDALVVAAFTPHNSPPRGKIAMINTRTGKNNPTAIFNFEAPDQPTADRGDSCDPWALSENVVLFSTPPDAKDAPVTPLQEGSYRRRNNPKLNALMLIDRTGKKVLVHSDPKIDLHDPILLVPRTPPRESIDMTDRNQRSGTFFVSDVYIAMPSVKRGTVKWLRVVEETSRVTASPGSTWLNQTFLISAALAWSPKIYHGIVPVEPDGSCSFEAPSGRALSFQLLDHDYKLVRAMRTFIQAAPGVSRSCVGCHEYNPQALTTFSKRMANDKPPRKLRDETWGSGHMDFNQRVQPILNAKCVSCHGGEQGVAKGLDLSGGWTEFFNISYEHLTARREKMYTADLVGGICGMNGTAYWSCKVFDPYTHGSGKAILADVLLREPHRGRLTQTERETIFAWMDSNAIYFGTWDYTEAGPTAKPFLKGVARVKGAMQAAGCVSCHADDKGEIKRFDQWVNLERPEMSTVLRAPLPLSTTAEGGYGLVLCRNRKLDQSFSRKGLIYGFGYAHGVMQLKDFPTQVWPNVWPPEGESVTTFKSVDDPHYQEILKIIRETRNEQLSVPRIDMPGADLVGKGVQEGRSRQILPVEIPEQLPEIEAQVDDNGFVLISWEHSCRTIGLVAEIHRGAQKGFTPNEKTLAGSTERGRYCDRQAPAGKVYYAVVFVSDPAATCGTCKSGEALNYQQTKPEVKAMAKGERSPLSSLEPVRAAPVYAPVVNLPAKLPLWVSDVQATPASGRVILTWQGVGIPGGTTYDVYARRIGGKPVIKLNSAPLAGWSFTDTLFHGGELTEYAVIVTAARRADASSEQWIAAQPLPVRHEPVFALSTAAPGITLQGNASFDKETLHVSEGGWAVVHQASVPAPDAPFSFVLEVFFDAAGEMPVLLGAGTYQRDGWFLQKFNGKWRFHLAGLSCDGGQVPIGEWVRLVGLFDGKTARLYQNGQSVAEVAVPIAPTPCNRELYIGQYQGSSAKSYQFTGKIRFLSLYERTLDAAGK
ncbi:MAG: hypothetical protein PHO37_14285 [Kiritimatiellae bacterium]|nr:hypothetical protein [Kiritimatiellia bacterium]